MARNRSLIALALLIGCKSDPKTEPPPTPPKGSADIEVETSPECAAKVAELGPWLEKLELEQASHEIDFGYSLQVIDRAPAPLPRRIDIVMIEDKELNAFDANESNYAQSTFEGAPTQKMLDDKLALMFAAKATDKPEAPDDTVRIDVDPKARWGDVVRVVDAATKAGYQRAMIAFTATSKLEPPLGAKPSYSDAEELSKANRRMEEIRETQCKEWDRAVMRHTWTADRAANARAVAKETADAIAACNCAANPEEVRALKWIDAHWHQATIRVPILVQLGPKGNEIALPAATPWSDAHAQVLANVAEGAEPRLAFVAK
jgi:hypothetical protein